VRLERFIAPTRSNRLMTQSGAYATATYLCLWCYSWALGGDFLTTLSVNMFVGAFGWGLLALIFDRWLLLTCIPLLLAALAFPQWPEVKFEIMGFAAAIGMAGTGIAWSRNVAISAPDAP